MESLYSILIKPPEEISEQITKSVRKVLPQSNIKPHISLGGAFYCPTKNFSKIVEGWLGMQDPFIFTLNRVENFERLVYLTSDNKRELGRIKDLYYGMKSILETEITYRQNNMTFVPHMTLEMYLAKDRVQELKSKFGEIFSQPLVCPIVEVTVNRKVNNCRWETLDMFTIGSGETRNGNRESWGWQLNPDECQFQPRDRALEPQLSRL